MRSMPAMGRCCYGSQFVLLTRADASTVVQSGTEYDTQLRGIYKMAMALPSEGHTVAHARFHAVRGQQKKKATRRWGGVGGRGGGTQHIERFQKSK